MSSQETNTEDSQSLEQFLADLLLQPEREPVASELGVLQSIYGDEAISPWNPSYAPRDGRLPSPDGDYTRYVVILSLPPPHDEIFLRILVSLPPTYPATSPPQLQLLSRYIGPFGVDSELFGSILKTFISVNGVEWTENTVCVFDGLESVLERLVKWYEDRLSVQEAGELLREDVKQHHNADRDKGQENPPSVPSVNRAPIQVTLPAGIDLIEAEPIVDRKSAFVGRACRISEPAQVPLILAVLMADRRIARAAHPIINAWRCQVGNVLYQDNDDDGESAAGGRLAHLLQLLDVNNVLVIVTRYFGGTLLGPDRFKHINQAARDALALGGLLETKRLEGRTKGSKR